MRSISLRTVAGLALVLLVTVHSFQKITGVTAISLLSDLIPRYLAEVPPPAPLDRVAERLQGRLLRRFGTSPSLATLRHALAERRRLFAQQPLTVTFAVEEGSQPEPWLVTLGQYPLWVQFTLAIDEATFRLSAARIREHLASFGIPGAPLAEHGAILSFEKDGKVLRAQVQGTPHDGYQYDREALVASLVEALGRGRTAITVSLVEERGSFALANNDRTDALVLLASGQSNFAGSPWGRAKNIEKAVQDHLTDILVPPGETFSFNAILGGPVTQSRGWHEALGIFGNGEELRPTPGGGLCQTSTTVYRAALAGGFPIVERSGHSLYVGYYRKYGVGLDATIFPGSKDLVFLNDTSSSLLIQASISPTKDLIVAIYGVPDGRSVALDGPYFAPTAPGDLTVKGRKLRENEIAWIQRILRPGGEEQRHVILSSYRKSIPIQQLLAESPGKRQA